MQRLLRYVALAVALAMSGSAFAQDKVSLRLNWLLYGFHSFFYLGVDKGFYKEEGIELTIGEGQGSGRTAVVTGAAGGFGRAEAFRRVLDVNLTGAFICSRVIVPMMLANPKSDNRGRIVFVSSIQAKEGMPRAAAYAGSKAGLIALTKTLGKELADSGILVNAITPAISETAMAKEITPARRQEILARIPMGRFVLVEEIAAQVAWLCSDDCSFATGAVFDLSGGRATW